MIYYFIICWLQFDETKLESFGDVGYPQLDLIATTEKWIELTGLEISFKILCKRKKIVHLLVLRMTRMKWTHCWLQNLQKLEQGDLLILHFLTIPWCHKPNFKNPRQQFRKAGNQPSCISSSFSILRRIQIKENQESAIVNWIVIERFLYPSTRGRTKRDEEELLEKKRNNTHINRLFQYNTQIVSV